ncbi:MAG: four helix bundle protein [Pirellulaceae bacterium]
MEVGRFRLDDFELYKIAREFRKRVYVLAKLLPPQEKYCLNPQMRRAAVSITNNIAEGHGRWHYQENLRFCRIARGSMDEILDDLNVCLDESYAQPQLIDELKSEAYALIGRINGYMSYLRRCQQSED